MDADRTVWAPKTEPIGRFIYEMGRTPRKNVGTYQRMHSSASKLDAGMVDWEAALKGCLLFHTSGISFGLAAHSGYGRNYLLAAFEEALDSLPRAAMVGLDFNYRSTLWSADEARSVMTPIISDNVDILITSIEDMAKIYGFGCGRYTAEEIDKGDMGELDDDEVRAFTAKVADRFDCKIVAVTIRYPDTFEQHRWESAAAGAGCFLPLTGGQANNSVGSAGRRRHVERRLLLRAWSPKAATLRASRRASWSVTPRPGSSRRSCSTSRRSTRRRFRPCCSPTFVGGGKRTSR